MLYSDLWAYLLRIDFDAHSDYEWASAAYHINPCADNAFLLYSAHQKYEMIQKLKHDIDAICKMNHY